MPGHSHESQRAAKSGLALVAILTAVAALSPGAARAQSALPGSPQAAKLEGSVASGVYLQAAVSAAASVVAANAAAGVLTERYTYDALGRLRQVIFANGAVTRYVIDKAGNRTNLASTAP